MDKIAYFLIICMSLLALSFGDGHKVDSRTEQVTVEKKEQLMPIQIYRYNDFSVSKAQFLKQELQRVYPSVELSNNPINLPEKYYYAPRDRYSGRGLLKDLSQYKRGTVVLGLTNEVIYEPNEKSPTFGIFGIGSVGGHTAVISSILPSRKKHSDEHLVKLMMHELGHSFGLNHCKDEHCFMVDAEHGNKFSKTPSFCPQCKAFLNRKGWTMK
ncbi:MAG: hypothetical protein IKH01_04245 [Prevotella sp.]|nr:hypothetical protein [Prevotella sp.]